jgi:hypothetical protein
MQAAEHWQTLAVKMVESLPSRIKPVHLPPEADIHPCDLSLCGNPYKPRQNIIYLRGE